MRPGLSRPRPDSDSGRGGIGGRIGGGLVGAEAVEGAGVAALAGGCRRLVEQVAVVEGGGLEFGVGLAEAEALH